jgi:hypothetical protein
MSDRRREKPWKGLGGWKHGEVSGTLGGHGAPRRWKSRPAQGAPDAIAQGQLPAIMLQLSGWDHAGLTPSDRAAQCLRSWRLDSSSLQSCRAQRPWNRAGSVLSSGEDRRRRRLNAACPAPH